MALLSEKITKPPSVEILEMVARKVIQFTVELGFVHSVFEVDSRVIIKSLVDGNSSLASIRHLWSGDGEGKWVVWEDQGRVRVRRSRDAGGVDRRGSEHGIEAVEDPDGFDAVTTATAAATMVICGLERDFEVERAGSGLEKTIVVVALVIGVRKSDSFGHGEEDWW
ncbi:hypothetical protein SO802_023583 [Lithocarpus litseifolius]|uniref:RNase H type-1 domain-containing protein n=1 Tax=Lithocarpus litseifolius TaxID=425828 RepID=A0AAW2CA32_9ROSI